MFESAVQSHPSEKMLYLQRAAADCRANVDFEAANTAALENVGRMCVTARGAYLAAIRALDAAQSTNRGAQFNNVLGGRNGGLEVPSLLRNPTKPPPHPAAAPSPPTTVTSPSTPPSCRLQIMENIQQMKRAHSPAAASRGRCGPRAFPEPSRNLLAL